MTPREIIAQTLRNTTYKLPDAILSALTTAGYRLVGPGEVDAETVERCPLAAGTCPLHILYNSLEPKP